MRLVCPNCSAQYEIDEGMIPDEGRDVQCSNCGHTWFELPGPKTDQGTAFETHETADEEEPVDEEYEAAEMSGSQFDDEDQAEPEPEPEPEPEDDDQDTDVEPAEHTKTRLLNFEDGNAFGDDDNAKIDTDIVANPKTRLMNLSRDVFEDDADAPQNETIGWDDADDNDDGDDIADAVRAVTGAPAEEPVAKTTRAKPRRPADAAALDILREEANRELSQRRTPPSENIETQTDLGLESSIRRRGSTSRALRARMAHLGEELPEEEPEIISEPTPPRTSEPVNEARQRDVLPDIDEINSTLKRSDQAVLEDTRKKSGFRAGFLLVLFLVAALIFTYAQAPAIAKALPGTESTLISFVDNANMLRDWIDGLIGN